MCVQSTTYIVAEGDKVFAHVVGEERQCLVQASILVHTGVLSRDQRQIWQLELIEGIFVAHGSEKILKTILLRVLNFDRNYLVIFVVPECGDTALLPDAIAYNLFRRAFECVQ